jgi:hypothetical protein
MPQALCEILGCRGLGPHGSPGVAENGRRLAQGFLDLTRADHSLQHLESCPARDEIVKIQ